MVERSPRAGSTPVPKTKGILFPKIVPAPTSPAYAVPLDFKHHKASKLQLSEMDAEITATFGAKIDLFTISSEDEKPQALSYPFIGAPQRYFNILTKYISAKYPAEAEARAYVDTYRHLYLWNQVTFIAIKRAVLFLALLFICDPSLVGRLGLPAFELEPEFYSATIGAVIFFSLIPLVTTWYISSHENSSSHVSVLIQGRLNDLSQFFNNCITDIDRAGAHIGRNPDAWNEQAKFLVRLALYVSRRFEYFERYVQIEMWRVRRLRHWTLYGGAVSVLAIVWYFAATVVPGLGEAFSKGQIGYDEFVGLGRLTLIAALSWLSMMWGRVSLTAARDAMQHQNWRRFPELAVDEEFGSQVGRDKRLLAQAAQQNIFQANPPSGHNELVQHDQ